MNIQWYPGHMTKTRRQIEADLKHVDIVVEIIDARSPVSSRNPDIDAITGGQAPAGGAGTGRTRLTRPETGPGGVVPEEGLVCAGDRRENRRRVSQFSRMVQEVLKDQIARWQEKGLGGPSGAGHGGGVPNVGKSTFINKVARKKSAKASDRPGVTRGKQWVTVDRGLELLDTPGILWPKFEDVETGMRLAFTGAVKDDIMDVETLGCHLMAFFGDAVSQCAGGELPPEGRSLPGRRRRTRWLTATACWRPAPRSGGCGSPGESLTLSGWPGCCWMSTGVASWDALPWNSRKRFKEIV